MAHCEADGRVDHAGYAAMLVEVDLEIVSLCLGYRYKLDYR